MSDRWGEFWLEQLVAVGGLGEVWRATKDGATGALKRMHTHLARNAEALAIFAQEQRLVMDLPRHPNVVHGIECGSVESTDPAASPRPFAFLELAPGADLRRIVAPPATRERPTTGSVTLARDRAIWIVAAACDAAAHLHANGWVHGDVNPSNLIVSPAVPGSDPPASTLRGMTAPHTVKLVDLGIARPIGDGGPVRGTHAYMAPEQVRAQTWTAATDVFALGIVLWELCANTRLFHRGPTWLSMAAVVEADVPALPDKELDAICRAALVKDPAHRLSSASELADRLRALGAN